MLKFFRFMTLYVHKIIDGLTTIAGQFILQDIFTDVGNQCIRRQRNQFTRYTQRYFVKALRQKFIIINDTLDDDSKRIVTAHELGHAVLHSSQDMYSIREHTLFPTGPYEVEANKFAAELLIDSRDIDKYMLADLNAEQISHYLGVNEQLVEYKLKKK